MLLSATMFVDRLAGFYSDAMVVRFLPNVCSYADQKDCVLNTYRVIVDNNFLDEQGWFILISVQNMLNHNTTLFLWEEEIP